jgi:hypothetical protein
MTSSHIDHNAVGNPSAFTDNNFQIGTIGICGKHSAAAHLQEEKAAFRCGWNWFRGLWLGHGSRH